MRGVCVEKKGRLRNVKKKKVSKRCAPTKYVLAVCMLPLSVTAISFLVAHQEAPKALISFAHSHPFVAPPAQIRNSFNGNTHALAIDLHPCCPMEGMHSYHHHLCHCRSTSQNGQVLFSGPFFGHSQITRPDSGTTRPGADSSSYHSGRK